MANSEDYRIPCTRCGDPVTLSAEEYEQTGDEAYCQDCLVPFTCPSCGERKSGTPENVNSDGETYCASCGVPGGPTTGQRIARGLLAVSLISIFTFSLGHTGSINGAIDFMSQNEAIVNSASLLFLLGIYAFK